MTVVTAYRHFSFTMEITILMRSDFMFFDVDSDSQLSFICQDNGSFLLVVIQGIHSIREDCKLNPSEINLCRSSECLLHEWEQLLDR